MLNTTEAWLGDEAGFRKPLADSGPLGVGILKEIENAHEPLAQIESKRGLATATLRTLIDAARELDATHDRKARAVHFLLRGLSEGSDDAAKAAEYRELEGLLFPRGLSVVNLPHIEEGGAAVALERTVSPATRAKMAQIKVGDQTLDDLFAAWITAGHELGKVVEQRAKLKASLSRDGSAVSEIDLRAGHAKWVKAVRGLLMVIDMSPELDTLGERVHGALDEAIAAKLRARASGSPEDDGGGADASANAEADADADADEDQAQAQADADSEAPN
ncbi:hypothetical protein [Enhygromyxa salina]|nr:hypothetical protein [Enhygromyxa salina]